MNGTGMPVTVDLNNFDSSESELFSEYCRRAEPTDAVALASFLMGFRDAARVTAPDPAGMQMGARDNVLQHLFESADIPFHGEVVNRGDGRFIAKYYISRSPVDVREYAQTDTSDPRTTGEFLGYGIDVITAFEDGTALDRAALRSRVEQGDLREDEGRDVIAILPYQPPEVTLDEHVAEAQKRRTYLMNWADYHDFPELRNAVDKARSSAFRPGRGIERAVFAGAVAVATLAFLLAIQSVVKLGRLVSRFLTPE